MLAGLWTVAGCQAPRQVGAPLYIPAVPLPTAAAPPFALAPASFSQARPDELAVAGPAALPDSLARTRQLASYQRQRLTDTLAVLPTLDTSDSLFVVRSPTPTPPQYLNRYSTVPAGRGVAAGSRTFAVPRRALSATQEAPYLAEDATLPQQPAPALAPTPYDYRYPAPLTVPALAGSPVPTQPEPYDYRYPALTTTSERVSSEPLTLASLPAAPAAGTQPLTLASPPTAPAVSSQPLTRASTPTAPDTGVQRSVDPVVSSELIRRGAGVSSVAVVPVPVGSRATAAPAAPLPANSANQARPAAANLAAPGMAAVGAPTPRATPAAPAMTGLAPTAEAGTANALTFTAYYRPNQLLAENEAALADQLRGIAPTDVRRVLISGFTDATGSDDLNMRLSRQRVDAVANYLVRAGLNPRLLYKQYFGSRYASPTLVTQERQVQVLILLK